jgi:hypothetical protein
LVISRLAVALFAIIALAVPTDASAQNKPVFQTGLITPGHTAKWITPGVVGDAGGAANGGLTELGITNTGTPFCINDVPFGSSGGWHQFCLGANALGGGLISYNAYGGASALGLNINLNGTTYSFPGSGAGNVTGPNASVVDNIAPFNNTSGTLLKDSGISVYGVPHQLIKLIPPPGTTSLSNPATPWLAITPDGSAVPGINSTTSSGFNEVEAYAYLKGWSVEVTGPGETSGATNTILLTSSTGFIIKPLAQRYISFNGVLVQCTSAVTGRCVSIDTIVEGGIFCQGTQFAAFPSTGGGSSATIYIHPNTGAPIETGAGVWNSTVQLCNVVMQAGAGTANTVVEIDTTSKSLSTTLVQINEINSAGAGSTATADYNIYIHGAESSNLGMSGMIFQIGELHYANKAAIQDGTSVTNQADYIGNQWYIGACLPGSDAAAQCLNEFGSNNSYRVGVTNNGAGTYQYFLYTQTGAAGNTFEFQKVANATGASGNNPGWGNVVLTNTVRANGLDLNIYKQSGLWNGFAPTNASSCGTNSVSGVNSRWKVTVTAGTPAACTLNFSITWPQVPTCVVWSNADDYWRATSVSTSALTFANHAASIGNSTEIYGSCE